MSPDPPSLVGSSKDIHQAAVASGRILNVFLGVMFGLNGVVALILPLASTLSWYFLLGALGACTWELAHATRPGPGPDRPLARWALRLAWLPFLTSWPLLYTGLTLWLQLPFLLGLGLLLLSHVRPGRPRLWLLVYLLPRLVLLSPAWFLYLGSSEISGLFGLAVGFWGLAFLQIFVLPSLSGLLDPGHLPALWETFAGQKGWAVQLAGDTWFRAHKGRLSVTVERDPVPVRTRWVLQLPELAGLTVRRGSGAGLGDPVLDAILSVQGPRERVHEVLSGAREAWLQVVHGCGGVLRDGELVIVLEGDDPSRWVPHPEGAPRDYSLQQLVTAFEEIEAAATAPRSRAPIRPMQRQAT